jgi:hypothetical protein
MDRADGDTPSLDELERAYRQADRRLRELLFGDGTYTAGLARGEEARGEATGDLRRMRDAFVSLLERQEERVEKAEARVADLERELRKIAASKSRRSAAKKP